ncbi:DMT family transporter [Marinobacterium arenosum]|uniref:DMT family transporter n=1 Tax=Marinobacterium arenosum TaxID=2862496 RepID=UPI001C94CC38|nr:DMT family transporter [Marinobacterium arenosum]MBY4675605.1 DMT family transporter [Marinobacterium arenosum]
MLSRNLAVVGLLMAMLLWASSFIALKLAFQHYDPMVVMFGRMFVASLCFLLFFKAIARFEYRAGDWKYLALMVLSEPCFYFVFEAKALQNTSAQQAGMITALLPLLVGIGAWLWLKERLSRQAWMGFALAVAGAVWLSVAGESTADAPNPVLGNFYEFCAMVCATGYTLCLKHLSERYSPWLLTALQSFCGSLFFLPMMALPDVSLPEGWVPQALIAIVYLGTVVNILAYGLYNLSVASIPASQASAFVNMIPVFTLGLAYLILGETLNLSQLAAAALVIGGIILSQWQFRPAEERDSELTVA